MWGTGRGVIAEAAILHQSQDSGCGSGGSQHIPQELERMQYDA